MENVEVQKETREERPVISFRLRSEDKQKAEEFAQRFDTSLSTAARIIYLRGLEVSPETRV